jgi:Ca2+-binding EF-hand superfamily protein
LTTRGDLERKLDFAFTLYDSDNNGILTKEKMKPVVYGMLDLIVRYELV